MPTFPCPSCTDPVSAGSLSCPACALPLRGATAAQLWQVDQQIAALTGQRTALLESLRAGTDAPSDSTAPAQSPDADVPAGVARTAGVSPLSALSPQQLLLAVGAGLLLVAALVFLAVGWDTLPLIAQAAVLLALPATAGGAAVLACRRSLPVAAGTLGSLTVALTVADAYAARSLPELSLQQIPDACYAFAVAGAVTAIFGAAGVVTGLRAWVRWAVGAAHLLPLLAVFASQIADSQYGAVSIAGVLLAQAVLAIVAPGLLARRASGQAVHRLSAGRGVNLAAAAAVGAAGVLLTGTLAAHGNGYASVLLAAFGALLATGAAAGGARVLLHAPISNVLVPQPGNGALLVRQVQLLGGAAAISYATATAAIDSSVTVVAAMCAAAIGIAIVTNAGLALRSTAGAAGAALTAPAIALAGLHLLDTDLPVWHLSFAVAAALAVLTARQMRERMWAAPAAAGAVTSGVVAMSDGPLQQMQSLAAALTALALAYLGLAAWRRSSREEPGLLTVAAVTGGLAVCAATAHGPGLAAAVLALLGLAALGYAALPARGRTAVVAVALLGAANAVQLARTGVDMVELYTLPVAALLAAVALVAVRRDPAAPSWRTWGPAGSTALLPSALVAFDDPQVLRVVLAALAASAVLLAGVAWRLKSPISTGTAALALLALAELGPYAMAAPRWLTLGGCGLLLVAAGVSYEKRLADARKLREWYSDLR